MPTVQISKGWFKGFKGFKDLKGFRYPPVSDCCIVPLPQTHFKPIQVDTMRRSARVDLKIRTSFNCWIVFFEYFFRAFLAMEAIEFSPHFRWQYIAAILGPERVLCRGQFYFVAIWEDFHLVCNGPIIWLLGYISGPI